MKNQKTDIQLKNILNDGLMKKAPRGMVDRIMAKVAVNPARKLTVKAVEPKSYIATLVPILTGVLVAIAAFLKPESRFSFSIDQYINFNSISNLSINPIWVAPMLVIVLVVWGYIFIDSRTNIQNETY